MTKLVEPESWVADAACANHDRDVWFPERSAAGYADTKIAKAICATCPVRAECLDYALRAFNNKDDHGIWAGTSVSERRLLRTTRGRYSPTYPHRRQPCGTPAAYRRHLRHDEIPCEACRHANAAYQQGKRTDPPDPVRSVA